MNPMKPIVGEKSTCYKIFHKCFLPTVWKRDGKMICCFKLHSKPQIDIVMTSYSREEGALKKTNDRLTVSIKDKRCHVFSVRDAAGPFPPGGSPKRNVRGRSNRCHSVKIFIERWSPFVGACEVRDGASFTEIHEAQTKSVVMWEKSHSKYFKRFHLLFAKFARENGIPAPHPTSGVYPPDSVLYLLCYPALRDLLKMLQPKGCRTANPLFASFKHEGMPSLISSALRKPTFKQAVHKLLHKDNKRLMKAIYKGMELSKSWLTPLMVARVFRDVVPIDYIYEILESEHLMTEFRRIDHFLFTALSNKKSLHQYRPTLETMKLFSPQKWKNILFHPNFKMHEEWANLNDIHELVQRARQYGVRLPDNFRTIRQYHDTLVRSLDGVYLDPQKTIIIPNDPLPQHVESFVEGNWSFNVPKNTDELRQWGSWMRNCMGNYSWYINQGNLIFGIFKGQKMTYAMSLNKVGKNPANPLCYEVSQFYAACNQYPDPTEREEILRILKHKGLISYIPEAQTSQVFQQPAAVVAPQFPDINLGIPQAIL